MHHVGAFLFTAAEAQAPGLCGRSVCDTLCFGVKKRFLMCRENRLSPAYQYIAHDLYITLLSTFGQEKQSRILLNLR